MPLIVPGVTANNLDDSKTQEWANKLMGKTLTDGVSSETAFSKADLPKNARVVQPGTIHSTERVADRLNVAVDDNGIISKVHFG